VERLRTGIDLIEIDRISEIILQYGDRFLKRIYTPRELAEVGFNPASLSARFAAKEAVAKTFGTGIGRVNWQDIEILRGPEREPQLHLHGNAAILAKDQGLVEWAISLTHSRTHAIAVVVALME
jgi:holo-[acyl-carrier protein] synthase